MRGVRQRSKIFSKTLLMADNRVIHLKLEGLVRSMLRPLGIGIMMP